MRKLRIEDVVLDEDVIVVSPGHPMHGKIGQIWKEGTRGEQMKVSVCFEGEVYNFPLDELTLA